MTPHGCITASPEKYLITPTLVTRCFISCYKMTPTVVLSL